MPKFHIKGTPWREFRRAICGITPAPKYDFVEPEKATCLKCLRLAGLPPPTPAQVAWVFAKLIENTKRDDFGTFRFLIYSVMGFSGKNYQELYQAGGMVINNILISYFHPGEGGENV